MKFKDKVSKIYRKIKLIFYKSMFKKLKGREEELTSSEFFCLECIYLMEKPTISQFANFLDISSPNATYKVKQLIKKGYIQKERSKEDGREFILLPTKKFFDFYESKDSESTVVNNLQENLNKDEAKEMEEIVSAITQKKKV